MQRKGVERAAGARPEQLTAASTPVRLRGVARQIISFVLGTLLLCASAWATDYTRVELTRPLDGTRFGASVVSSIFIPGTTSDLRPLPPGVDGLVESLAMCPSCRFTAHYRRFEEHDGLDIERAKKALAELRTSRLFQKLDAASAVEAGWDRNPETLAHLALAAKWKAEETGETQLIRERTLRDIAAFERVWEILAKEVRTEKKPEKPEPADPEEETEPARDRIANKGYLLGELHRGQ